MLYQTGYELHILKTESIVVEIYN